MAKTDVQIFFRRIVTQCKNSHWKKQSLRMEEKYWKYINFVGHMETITNDAEQLLKLIGAWNEYGSNGWNDYDGRIFAPKQSMGRKHQTNASEKLQQYITSIEFEADLERFYSNDYRNPILNLPLKRIFPDIDHERYHHNKEDNSSTLLSSVTTTTTSSTINYNSVNDDRGDHSTKTETINEISSETSQTRNQDEDKNTKNAEDETSSEEDDLSKLMDGNDITLPYDQEFQSATTSTTLIDDNRSNIIHNMNNEFSDDNNHNNDMIIQQQRMQKRHEENIDSEDNIQNEEQQHESDDNTITQSLSNENDENIMNQEVTNQDSYQDIDTEDIIGNNNNNNNDEVDVKDEDDENNAAGNAANFPSPNFIDAVETKFQIESSRGDNIDYTNNNDDASQLLLRHDKDQKRNEFRSMNDWSDSAS